MEKTQEERSASDENDKRSEYHFVYNRAALQKAVVDRAVLLFTLVISTRILGAEFSFHYFYTYVFASAVVIAVFLLALFSIYYLQLRITLNQEGITCSGFWFGHMPRHYAWKELSRIGEVSNRTFLVKEMAVLWSLVFIPRDGKPHFLVIGNHRQKSFVGVGHSLSLEKAIEQFAGPIKLLYEKKKKEGFLRENAIFLSMALGVIAVMVIAFVHLSSPPFLQNDLLWEFFYWMSTLCFLGAFSVSFWYRWDRIAQRVGISFWTFLSGFFAVAIFAALSEHLPKWQGKEEQVVFTISKENEEKQYWTAIAEANLTFSIRTDANNRVYNGIGTERTMTIYRGPGSLKALPEHECYALYRKVPKGYQGNPRPGRCR